MQAKRTFIYVGTWGEEQSGHGKGIYTLLLDMNSGSLTYVCEITGVPDAGFVEVSPDQKYLYSVNEMTKYPDMEDGTGGGITAFRIDEKTGVLSIINQTLSLGSLPCYLFVDNQYVFCANHATMYVLTKYVKNNSEKYELKQIHDNSGVAMFKIRNDGGIADCCDLTYFDTVGSAETYKNDLNRISYGYRGRHLIPLMLAQGSPHIHSINVDPDGLAVVCDRGCDMIYLFKINREDDKLEMLYSCHTRLGTGPRHSAFHPYLPYLYIINELESSITTFSIDKQNNTISELKSIDLLPEGVDVANAPADIHIHPNGMFVYGSNRGHNSISSYSVDKNTGLLTFIENILLDEPSPRSFNIEPSGKFLIVGNMDSDRVVSYKIDSVSGKLIKTGYSVDVPTPTCIRFAIL